jgi:hypothetical protein
MKHYGSTIVLIAIAAGWPLFVYALPLTSHF